MKYKGFTLVEMLLYMGLSLIVLSALGTMTVLIMESSTKSKTVREVEDNGLFLIDQITYEIANASSIASPTPNNTAQSLSLIVSDPSDSPTVFSLASGVLRVARGAAAPIALSTNDVTVSALSFQNVSQENTPGSIKFQFTLEYKSQSERQEYSYSQTFYGSSSIRR